MVYVSVCGLYGNVFVVCVVYSLNYVYSYTHYMATNTPYIHTDHHTCKVPAHDAEYVFHQTVGRAVVIVHATSNAC